MEATKDLPEREVKAPEKMEGDGEAMMELNWMLYKLKAKTTLYKKNTNIKRRKLYVYWFSI